MDGIDPEVLLEWLQTGMGDERDLQLMALEQLCMLLLMSDNIDRCFESCPPRTFLPALCRIFLDETAPENVLEVTARAITYYLDVSNECTRRITQVEGAVKAICNRLTAAEMTDRTSKDLAEQCVKLLEHVCQRETIAVYEAGGMHTMLTLVRTHGTNIHRDTMYSAMLVVQRLCGKMEPNETALPQCAESLGILLAHEDPKVSESALRCFAALTDRYLRKMLDPAELATHSNLVEHLLKTLSTDMSEGSQPSTNFLSTVLSLISNLCRGSAAVTEQVLSSPHLMSAISCVLTNKDDRCVTDGLRLTDLLVVLLCEGRSALPHSNAVSGEAGASLGSGTVERAHRHLIDAIRQKDLNALVEAIESNAVEPNFMDDVGQTLCNWASAFGSIEMVHYLCDKGADVNKGQKSSSLHYAACFGRPDIVKLLLQRGANPDLRDEDGKTALDKARERLDDEHREVAQILESPSVYMHSKTEEGLKQGLLESRRCSQAAEELADPALAAKVLPLLMNIFCDVFQKSLSSNVRRTTLSLIRKVVEQLPSEELRAPSRAGSEDVISRSVPEGAESLIAVVVAVLEQEDDYETQEQVLLILSSLLKKDPTVWVGELVRLGVFERVEAMAKEPPNNGDDDGEMSDGADELNARNSVMSRSTMSTPCAILEGEVERVASSASIEERERDRLAMLDIPVSSRRLERSLGEENIPKAATLGSESELSTETPPPTVEVVESPSMASSLATRGLAFVSSLAGKEEKKNKIAITQGIIYRWKEWRLVRGDSSLFVWSDILVFEFSQMSNGWFHYMMDGDVATMFNNGLADTDGDKVEAKKAFMTRFRRAKSACGEDNLPVAILCAPTPQKAEIPQWELSSTRTTELVVKHVKGDGQIVIKDELGSFSIKTADKLGKTNYQPETALSPEFHTGWSAQGMSPRRVKFRAEIQRRRVQELAWELWNNHLKDARAKPREALLELQKAADVIEEAVVLARKITIQSKHRKHVKQPRIEKLQELMAAVRCVRHSVEDDRRLSTFEFCVSGVIPALQDLLLLAHKHPLSYPARIFKEAFAQGKALSNLATKMVAVLEANEKFEQYLYDTPGGSPFGLQMLSRRVRLRLAYNEPEIEEQKTMINRDGKVVKSEPLTSVGQLKSFLLKMVAKQWYDHDRPQLGYVRTISEKKGTDDCVKCVYTKDFDQEGVIYWIGTNGKTSTEWVNPVLLNFVFVTCSDLRQAFGKPEDVLSRDASPLNCHTSDDKNANFTIDLGVMVYPSAYTLRHARGYGKSALRNWLLQGSRDAQTWDVLVAHSDDESLNDPGSTATWPIEDDRNKGPFRYFRIAQNGKNASGQSHYISISGFEIYGDIVDVVVDGFEKPKALESSAKVEFGRSQRLHEETPSSSNISATGKLKERLGLRTPKSRLKTGRPDKADTSQAAVLHRVASRQTSEKSAESDSSGGGPSSTHHMIDMFRNRGRGLIAGRENLSNQFSSFTGFAPFANRPKKASVTSNVGSLAVANSGQSSSGSTSATIGKKSMSTTNLVEEKPPGGPSVASTGQAASAESLQHQTHSLENLLQRANAHAFGRIAESAEGSDTPEPGRQTPLAEGNEQQQQLSTESIDSVVDTQTIRDSVTPPGSQPDGMNSLSVSAPDLAAGGRPPQSSDAFEVDTTVEEVEDEHEDEEEEEESDAVDREGLGEDTMHSAERRLIDHLREVLDSDDAIRQLIDLDRDDAAGPSSQAANADKQKKKSSLTQKVTKYADVLKGLVRMMEPSDMDVEELLDEDDYYEDEEANEEELEDDLRDFLPVESLAHVFSPSVAREGLKINWKHLTQMMSGGTAEGLNQARDLRTMNRQTLRNWDDELVLKCTFPALIPAFDPRPGRVNVNQTQDVELPAIVSETAADKEQEEDMSLRLFLRGPNISGVENVTLEMNEDSVCIFHYLQTLMHMIDWGAKIDHAKRIWEPTYTILYEDAAYSSKTEHQLAPDEQSCVPKVIKETLEVIGHLSELVEKLPDAQISQRDFISDKLTLKLKQELSDALVVTSRALPAWCSRLIYQYPCLFSVETRNKYLSATAFGVSRSIVWLQTQRDAAVDRVRGTSSSSTPAQRFHDKYQEFRVGRLKHERVKISRAEEHLLEQAVRLMKFHSDRKAVLEIEYSGEEGTGLGPTLEFYALMSAETQRKALAMWLCDDMDEQQLKMEEKELDLGEGKKPPGYYVRRAGGLFPAPLPPHTDELRRAADMFRILGIFLAKVIQDGRLVDLPLARPFYKMLVSNNLAEAEQSNLDRVLNLDDLEEVHPVKGSFLKELRALAQRKRAIETDGALDMDAKRRKIDELKLCFHGTRCRVEDLALNFTVNPPSSVFEYKEMELVEGGADMDVTMENVDLYVERCADFYLNSGIAEQMRAFRDGFDKVFPLRYLRSHSPEEIQRLVSGEQCPEWTRDDIMQYTDPKLGYTKESDGFLRFVDVMTALNAQERKNFLQFATGCSSLPPGGLANLHPRLTIVRKVESGDGSYPSVNTCVHYLKLPEYSSAEILRERLLTAINEKGFHLN